MTAPHIGRRCCGPATAGHGETVAENPATPHIRRWVSWCVGARCMAWRTWRGSPFEPPEGYCGLVSRPEIKEDWIPMDEPERKAGA